MFGRIQNIDNRVLDNISRIHKPALNKIMILHLVQAMQVLYGGQSACRFL